MKRRVLTVAMASLALVAASTPVAQAQGTSAETAVKQVATEFVNAWNAHDNGRVMAVYDGPTGWFIVGGNAIPTLDSLRKYHESQFSKRVSDEVKWTRMQVKLLGSDAAYFQGWYGGTVVYKDGRTVEYQDNASMTALVERRNGAWKFTSASWTNGAAKVTTK